MILADTSIWIEHFRSGNTELRSRLDAREIVIHPFVIAELALGSLRDRSLTLAMLDMLPRAKVAQLAEIRQMVEGRGLYSRGIGLIDVHLVASALLDRGSLLWTKDARLRQVAEDFGLSADLPYTRPVQ